MRLNEAVSSAKPLDVTFENGAVLHITYRVPEYTPNQAAALTSEATKDPRRMGGMINRIVESWDLTFNDGEPIPLDPESVSEHVHLGILSKIMETVNKDSMPGEQAETSSVG